MMHIPCSRRLRPSGLSIATAVLACLVAGCPERQGPTPTSKPFVGTKIIVAAPAGRSFAANWKVLLDEWSEQTGATVEVREYGDRPEDPRLKDLLDPSGGSATLADTDLLIFSPAEFGELAADNRLATFSDDQKTALDRVRWIDLFQGLRENAASLEKRPAVAPLSSPVLVCYFRRDLLEKAGLSPPAEWSDYQKLLETLDRWAPGLTAVEPWGEEFRATMFAARAVASVKHPENFSVFFDIDSGEPLIDSPGFVRALETSRAAVARMPAAIKTYTPADCRREFFAGKAALAIAFETGPAGADPASSPVKRPDGMQVGICRLPGVREVYNRSIKKWTTVSGEEVYRVTLTGFAGLCAGVSAASTPDETQAAWNLLATLAVDRFDTAFGEIPRSPTRKSQTAAPENWTGPELSGDEQLAYVDAVSDALQDARLVVDLPVAGRDQFRKALSEELGKALTTPGDPQAALHAVADRWRDIAKQVGPDRVVNSYRRILGLPPRRTMK